MNDMEKYDEGKAIELGKIWMKNGINRGHDYEHASEVEKHAIEIMRSLEREGRLEKEIDKELISISVWWHDSYKARIKGWTLYGLIMEAYESEKIVRRELKEYVSPKRLEKAARAIRDHNLPIWYFLLTGKYPQVSQILFEADTIEELSTDRFFRSLNMSRNRIFTFLFKLYSMNRIFWWKFLPNSKYTQNVINEYKNSL
ncbi:MAG: hypothetical protein UT34_C0001G0497 [candidate division WS6 bacterium GW2011_GWF2_39_15]|uniref:HD domain-containing protein n=1 Tax=candidate division WS6 bacterium GW2011_GWF2_39_15 TaxID=1619100 RepID=A0A0G0N0T3_9BACT|nr:MAG: hypothetical protein UT34_C0001G0497 [candidate division WS6 bacterium GW2011_GWF2_39_15]